MTRGTDEAAIGRTYDKHANREWLRLTRSVLHRAEFALTTDLLDDYISPGSRVLDVGAGPGRYAEYAISLGAAVGLVDLSAESLRLFDQRIDQQAQESVIFSRQGSATDLGWVEPSSFDVVLLMGPLYHLVSADERRLTLAGVRRALKPDGVLVAAYLSPYQPLAAALAQGKTTETAELMRTGTTTHLGMQQYREWPAQAQQLMTSLGYDVIRTRNLEGLGLALSEHNLAAITDEDLFASLRMTCEIPDLLGATLHYVCVGRRC